MKQKGTCRSIQVQNVSMAYKNFLLNWGTIKEKDAKVFHFTVKFI